MKMLILATATVLGLGAGVAYAGDSDGPVPNTFFTELPGVIAQAPAQDNTAIAHNQATGAPTTSFVTNSHRGTWLFPPNTNQGANS
jgi:hypothetical protein